MPEGIATATLTAPEADPFTFLVALDRACAGELQ